MRLACWARTGSRTAPTADGLYRTKNWWRPNAELQANACWRARVERAVIATDRQELGAIFAGGAIGSGLRTLLAQAVPVHGTQFPWATFAVNVAGCLLLGYLVTRLQERLPVTAYRRPLLGTGFCGALTTFSAFQLELLQMLDHGALGLALIYLVASATAGFVGVALGTAVVRRARLTW